MVEISPSPVMLYFGPHPVHRKMADHVGAELVECATGGVADRVRAGLGRSFGDRPLILEGGVPLFEGAVVKLSGGCGPVIALGADATYHDIWDPLAYRERRERVAHRAALRFVDGTIAVSEPIATMARRLSGGPVRVAHPFVEHERYEALGDVDPALDGRRVLCVGKYRPKNGQDLLLEALAGTDHDVHVDFVGPDTEDLPKHPSATRHGFVSEKRLVELFGEAALLAFPAPAGAFPVATLEGLRAGLPVLTTSSVGTSEHARLVDPRLVVDADPGSVAGALEWYFERDDEERTAMGERAAVVGSRFDERTGLDEFERALVNILADLGADLNDGRRRDRGTTTGQPSDHRER